MIPVMQTQFLAENKPGAGNCHAACVASLLELPLEEVPNFQEIADEDERWIAEYEWLHKRGLMYLCVETGEHDAYLGWHIAIGPNVRNGVIHSCVYYGDDLHHDPNPAGGGLAEVQYRWLLIPLTLSKQDAQQPPEPTAGGA